MSDKCASCGKYYSCEGHFIYTPDTEFTVEECYRICDQCAEDEKESTNE